MPKEYEYHEGKQAQEDFEQGMRALFRFRKVGPRKRKSPQETG
jgi:hypothetical protein